MTVVFMCRYFKICANVRQYWNESCGFDRAFTTFVMLIL